MNLWRSLLSCGCIVGSITCAVASQGRTAGLSRLRVKLGCRLLGVVIMVVAEKGEGGREGGREAYTLTGTFISSAPIYMYL